MSNQNYDPHLAAMAMVHQELTRELQEQDLNYQRAADIGDLAGQRLAGYAMIDTRSRLKELGSAYNEYTAAKSYTPPQPTKEQEQAKPVDQMNWGDTWKLISEGETDPAKLKVMAEKFQEGMKHIKEHPTSEMFGKK